MTTNIGETFEKEVYDLISQCLSKNETICLDNNFDFYLPNGIEKINWGKNTYVEVKYRLIYNSLSRIKAHYDKIHPQKLIVIVIDDNLPSMRLKNNSYMSGRNIEVISYQDLQEKVSVNKAEDTSEEKEIKTEDTIIRNTINANIIEKAKDALKKNRISLFLGAGVSASAGIVTWDSLLEQLCIKKGLPKIDRDIDSIVKGRYIIDNYKKQEKDIPDTFYSDMKEILYAHTHSSKLIESIAKLIAKSNIESVISYNYDNLIEQEVKKKKMCYSVYDKSRVQDNGLCVYHVHGYIPQNDDEDWSPIVLGEKEYHKIYQESYNWGNVEQLHALCRSVCFFIGLSMTDPNLRRLIDISIDGSEIEPVHYAFLRKIEYDVPFMEKIMRGFGINCIWYDKHGELPDILESLTNS